VFESVGRHLDAELERASPSKHFGVFIGCAAEALVAAYAARQAIVSKAVARFACKRVVATARSSRAWDVQMGLAGALLAFAEIATVEPGALRDVRPEPLADRLLTIVDAMCALPSPGWYTGMAHGPAGAIVALEQCGALGWCRITTRRRQRWIDALCQCAVAGTKGALFWPGTAGQSDLGLQSWCSGTPGIALALLQCFRLTGEQAYLEFARGALEGMKRLSSQDFFSAILCCGSAGYRHIFLEAYRITGEKTWLEHALREARFTRSAQLRLRLGFHQGELGIAYLADRLANPLSYPFPGLGASSA
jgi:lantibiotic modifying enzyme